MCYSCWVSIHGISISSQNKVKRLFKEGYISIPRDQPTQKEFNGMKSCVTRAWMETYFNSVGEKMPFRDKIYLPSYLTKDMVHKTMSEILTVRGDNPLSKSRFCRLWKFEFSRVVIPRVSFVILAD